MIQTPAESAEVFALIRAGANPSKRLWAIGPSSNIAWLTSGHHGPAVTHNVTGAFSVFATLRQAVQKNGRAADLNLLGLRMHNSVSSNPSEDSPNRFLHAPYLGQSEPIAE